MSDNIYRSIFGRYRVLYPDNQWSLLFSYKSARNYMEMFGGKVVCVEPRWFDKFRKVEIDETKKRV